MLAVEARSLRKRFGNHVALAGLDLAVDEGRIVGLIGANGAGKTTLLHAMLGLTAVDGALRVLGLDPWRDRVRLMRSTAFVADSAMMPTWIRVSQAIDYFAAVHPAFDRRRTELLLKDTGVRLDDRVASLSKGMVAQLQLSLSLGIHARLLVLDEPTLGLDIAYRKKLFETLLAQYAEDQPTIFIATHEVEQVQHVLTDVVVLDRGRVAFQCTMDEFEERFVEVHVHPEHVEIARTLEPIHERPTLGGAVLMFDGADRERLSLFGDLRRPNLADVYGAVVKE